MVFLKKTFQEGCEHLGKDMIKETSDIVWDAYPATRSSISSSRSVLASRF